MSLADSKDGHLSTPHIFSGAPFAQPATERQKILQGHAEPGQLRRSGPAKRVRAEAKVPSPEGSSACPQPLQKGGVAGRKKTIPGLTRVSMKEISKVRHDGRLGESYLLLQASLCLPQDEDDAVRPDDHVPVAGLQGFTDAKRPVKQATMMAE